MTPVAAVEQVPHARILLDTGPSKAGAHRIQSVLTCATLYALTKKRNRSTGLTVIPGDGDRHEPLVRGTVGHVGLAHHYARMGCEQNGLDPETYYTPEEAIALVGPKHGEYGEKWARLMPAIYHRYAATYAVEQMKVRYVEFPCEVQVPVPDEMRRRDPSHPASYLFTQRWDLVLEDKAGRYWIYDHKFVSKVEDKTFQRYGLAMQFVSMAWLAPRVFGERFAGIRLNVIGVGSGTEPDVVRFTRAAPPVAPDAVRRFPATLAHAERLIRDVEALEDPMDAPRTFSETVCYTMYGACDGFEACRYGAITPHGA